MSDLLSSRWAPSASTGFRYSSGINANTSPLRRRHNDYRAPPASTSAANTSNTLLPPHEELSRFIKIVARLRWKLPFLAEGYRLATLTPSNEVDETDIAHAEMMFKIDFHEYYALLERAIVHLLGVFNIAVSSTARGYRGNNAHVNPNSSSNLRDHPNGNGTGTSTTTANTGFVIHRYHANVLQALEEESTPLTPILGSGHVHQLLRKAKELRNRWKTADLTFEEKERIRDPYEREKERKEVLPLSSFDFDEIFMGIFAGLEEAYLRARDHVELCRRPGEGEGMVVDSEADWSFMVEGMDWEAV